MLRTRREIGDTFAKMLTQTLRSLERDTRPGAAHSSSRLLPKVDVLSHETGPNANEPFQRAVCRGSKNISLHFMRIARGKAGRSGVSGSIGLLGKVKFHPSHR